MIDLGASNLTNRFRQYLDVSLNVLKTDPINDLHQIEQEINNVLIPRKFQLWFHQNPYYMEIRNLSNHNSIKLVEIVFPSDNHQYPFEIIIESSRSSQMIMNKKHLEALFLSFAMGQGSMKLLNFISGN